MKGLSTENRYFQDIFSNNINAIIWSDNKSVVIGQAIAIEQSAIVSNIDTCNPGKSALMNLRLQLKKNPCQN